MKSNEIAVSGTCKVSNFRWSWVLISRPNIFVLLCFSSRNLKRTIVIWNLPRKPSSSSCFPFACKFLNLLYVQKIDSFLIWDFVLVIPTFGQINLAYSFMCIWMFFLECMINLAQKPNRVLFYLIFLKEWCLTYFGLSSSKSCFILCVHLGPLCVLFLLVVMDTYFDFMWLLTIIGATCVENVHPWG